MIRELRFTCDHSRDPENVFWSWSRGDGDHKRRGYCKRCRADRRREDAAGGGWLTPDERVAARRKWMRIALKEAGSDA
jgi:hypothetical protein